MSSCARSAMTCRPGYYRELPKLAEGHLEGYPRVFGLAWAFVAHTDSRFDPEMLRRFVRAYQRVQPLTIGELWAVAITLRVVLVENLRRLAERMVHDERRARRLTRWPTACLALAAIQSSRGDRSAAVRGRRLTTAFAVAARPAAARSGPGDACPLFAGSRNTWRLRARRRMRSSGSSTSGRQR